MHQPRINPGKKRTHGHKNNPVVKHKRLHLFPFPATSQAGWPVTEERNLIDQACALLIAVGCSECLHGSATARADTPVTALPAGRQTNGPKTYPSRHVHPFLQNIYPVGRCIVWTRTDLWKEFLKGAAPLLWLW